MLVLIISFYDKFIQNTTFYFRFYQYLFLFHTTIVEFVKNIAFNDLFSGLMYKIKRLDASSLF